MKYLRCEKWFLFECKNDNEKLYKTKNGTQYFFKNNTRWELVYNEEILSILKEEYGKYMIGSGE